MKFFRVLAAILLGSVAALLVSVMTVSPSFAADVPPSINGTVIENASGSGAYSTDSKMSCPSGSSSIMDCTYFGELTGSAYKTLLADSLKTVEQGGHVAPLSIVADLELYYDYVGNNDVNDYSPIHRFVPITFDSSSGRAFFSYKMADFYYAAGTDKSRVLSNANGSSYLGSSGKCNYGKQNASNPDVVAKTLSESLYGAGVRCHVFNDGLDLSAMLGGSGPYLTETAFNDPARVKGFFVSLYKSITLISPKLSDGYLYSLMGADNGLATAYEGFKGGGFPFVEDMSASRASCNVNYQYTGGASSSNWFPNEVIPNDYETMSFGIPDAVKMASPSGSVMFNWVAYNPDSSNCFRVNTGRYSAPVVGADWVADSGNVISSSELHDLITGATPAEPPASDPFVRVDFATCVSIDPLNFKLDWPCIFESLFVVSPDAMKSAQLGQADLMKRFPFAFLPAMFDFANSLAASQSRGCVPFTSSFTLLGQATTFTLLPCDAGVAGMTKPISAWLFSIIILTNIGPWVLRKVLPGLPGDG